MSTDFSVIGSYIFPIETYLTDFQGKITLTTLGNYLLHAATLHADKHGFGYNCMQKYRRAWVLSRLAMEMYEYPLAGDDLEIQTWVEEVNKLFTLRNFAFKIRGKEIGYARSVWASIDLETRRPSNIFELGNIVDYVVDNHCPIERVSKIKSLGEGDCVEQYKVKYSDLDINKHVNSVKYIEHIIDLFPLEMLKERSIKRFEIVYVNESHYGDIWNMRQQQIETNAYVVELKNKQSEIICRSKIIF